MFLDLLMLPGKRDDGLAIFFLLMGVPHIYGALRAKRKKGAIADLKLRTQQFIRTCLFTLGVVGIVEVFSL